MKAWSKLWWIVVGYLILVVIAISLATVRLVESSEMLGLAAVELVLLALPWSLALGVEPIGGTGLPGMAGVVFGGVTLNTLLIAIMVRLTQRCWPQGQ